MTRLINTHALETRKIDSAALGHMAMIAHPMAEPGMYVGQVHKDRAVVAEFTLEVVTDEGATQADIDLGRVVGMPGAAKAPLRYRVSAGGYALFFVSQGPGGYRVVLSKRPERGEEDQLKPGFDSSALGKGDLFVLSLIRPGTWKLEERSTRAQATIAVSYILPGKEAYRPKEEATTLSLSDQGLSIEKLEIGPGEGVVIGVETSKAQFSVLLEDADDGPETRARQTSEPDDRTSRRVRWNNPRAGRP